MKTIVRLWSAAALTVLMAAAPKPKASPVSPFEVDKYLGKWYEIARMDYRHEKNLSNVTATYSLDEDGRIIVDNKGFNEKKKEWEQATGKARPADKDINHGKLKVSFFRPFWSCYTVIALDKNYRHALVAGKNTNYLWILSRDKILPESVKADFLDCASDAGYNTDELLWIAHDKD